MGKLLKCYGSVESCVAPKLLLERNSCHIFCKYSIYRRSDDAQLDDSREYLEAGIAFHTKNI